MEQLPLASLAAPSPSQYLTSRTQTLSAALGAPPLTGETENSAQSVRTEPITPAPTHLHSRVSTPQATPSSHSPGSAQSIQLTRSKTLDAESTSLIEWPRTTSESELASLSRELLQLQGKVTTVLRELLMVRASMYCQHRKLGLKVELAAQQNDTQLSKAEAQFTEAEAWHAKAKAWHTDTAAALHQAHLDSIDTLDQEMMAEEEQNHQAFMEEFSTALEACPLEDCWTLMYPLQLLASDVSLPLPRDASHNLATGHSWHGVCLCAPHIRHTSTQTQHQAVVSFIWPRHA